MQQQQAAIHHSTRSRSCCHKEPTRGSRSRMAAATIVASSDGTTIARIATRSAMSAARNRRNNSATTIIAAISDATIGIAIGIASMAIHAPPRSWTQATAMTAHSPRQRSSRRNSSCTSSNKSHQDARPIMKSCRSGKS